MTTGRVLLHLGAASPARRWPAGRWLGLATRLREVGLPLAVSAGPDERDLIEGIRESARLDDEEVVEPTTDLVEFAAAVAAARAVVVGDTGVAHLATAFARPSVVLFGPVSPALWGPPALPRHVAIWKGRHGDPHGRTTDPGLAAIDVDEVWAALVSVLTAPSAGSGAEERGYGRLRATGRGPTGRVDAAPG